ncbi:MAG: chemotaxis protein CheW [Xanthomonadales bacterium]|nr:chemotaxis protein CheW [Xanthomonadales bacterium]
MTDREIRILLAPLTNIYVMLPNSVIGEILTFSSPQPFKQGPSWLLGEIAWHGWQVPVINYERMLRNTSEMKITSKSRILIVKTLGESTQVNYLGLLIQGLPRLKKVTVDTLVEKQTNDLPNSVFSEVAIDDMQAVIPDIGDLTRIVEMAAYDS